MQSILKDLKLLFPNLLTLKNPKQIPKVDKCKKIGKRLY